ncbi:hypothetical protein SEA_ZENTENO07_104 [Mycobacterium phage Zenteno07]|nr:hypothetical protein SEA_ZENTENO07_104 [Mycobacterium phage Zenteno07]
MASKTTYVATAPDGSEFTRTSARTYSHAVICLNGETRETATWGYLAFSGREDLAIKEAKKWKIGVPYCSGDTFFEVKVVPVSIR